VALFTDEQRSRIRQHLGFGDAQLTAALLAALRSPLVVRALRHVRVVRVEALRSALEHEGLCARPFFRELLRGDWIEREVERQVDLYRRTIALGERLGLPSSQAQVDRARCLDALFERWRERALLAASTCDPEDPDDPERSDEPEAFRFPTPLLRGTDGVVPISGSASLLREGRRMRNCVFQFEEQCRLGWMVAYRVLSPERATLLLSVGETVEIYDLRAFANADVSADTVDAVAEWLASSRG
jgi:hypothetical protein